MRVAENTGLTCSGASWIADPRDIPSRCSREEVAEEEPDELVRRRLVIRNDDPLRAEELAQSQLPIRPETRNRAAASAIRPGRRLHRLPYVARRDLGDHVGKER